MKTDSNGAIILALSILMASSLIAASSTGILVTDFYAKETLSWRVQCLGQDWIDLIIVVPSLIISAYISYRKSKVAMLIWAGIVLYIFYAFIIYCFAVHFNRLFPLYCLILGLSFYSLLWFFYSLTSHPTTGANNNTVVSRITAIYFLVLPPIFYSLWLYEITQAIMNDTVPASLKSTGLFTNPVHVLDLAIFLPGIFIIGLLVLGRNPVRLRLATIMLTFFVIMDITIGWLGYLMYRNGLVSSLTVTAMMAGLAVITLILLTWNLKSTRVKETPVDLRPDIIT